MKKITIFLTILLISFSLLVVNYNLEASNHGQIKHGYVLTNDGVKIHYMEKGKGKPLVIIPGWAQSANVMKKQLALSDEYRVIILDMRGHGDSDKPEYGYRIHRLSKDLHEVLVALNLKKVNLMGWSMGCSVAWGYWDLFGSERLSKLILVEEPTIIAKLPSMSPEEILKTGAVWEVEEAMETLNIIAEDTENFVRGYVPSMLYNDIGSEEVEWLCQESLKTPGEYASPLMLNHMFADWRDVIPRITIPTLVIGTTKSLIPWESMQAISGEIPDSQFEVFQEASHMVFYEKPEEFNAVVREFLQDNHKHKTH